MVKLSGSRKKFILRVFVVLIACAFLATSLAPSIGHSGTSANTKSMYDLHSIPLLSNNNSYSAGYVKYTLVLSNNTLIKGNFLAKGIDAAPYAIADAVAYDPSNGYVYVTNWFSNNVYVINGTTNSVIKTVSVGSGPLGVAYDPSNGYVYVTNYCSNNVFVINGSNNSVIEAVSVDFFSNSYPVAVAYDPSNGYVYVTNQGSNSVSVINGTTNSIIKTISVRNNPEGVAYDPSNGYVYVANWGSNSVSVINGTTNSVIKTVSVGSGPAGVEFDSSNGYVYVAICGSNSVSVINGTTNSVIKTISVGSEPDAVAYDPSNDYVYVANYNSGTISIISTSSASSNKYAVTFTETGLPSGTTWYVNLSNGVDSGAITGTSYTFSLTNGTYPYTVSNVSGYSVSPSSGSITVTGKSFNQAITFTPTTKSVSKYTVTFTESGLPSGTTWYLNLSNGQKFSSTTDIISFSEPNGTYSYTIGNVSGYSPSPSSGSISINGTNVSKNISFKAINKSKPSSGITSEELYLIIGMVVAIAVIGSVFAIKRRKR